jgi:hypothetical protein
MFGEEVSAAVILKRAHEASERELEITAVLR